MPDPERPARGGRFQPPRAIQGVCPLDRFQDVIVIA